MTQNAAGSSVAFSGPLSDKVSILHTHLTQRHRFSVLLLDSYKNSIPFYDSSNTARPEIPAALSTSMPLCTILEKAFALA